MLNQIVKIDPKEFGLEETKAQEIEAQFKPMLEKMVELEKEYNEIVTLEISKETCEKAKALKQKYVKVRTGTADIHKLQKAFYLAGGRFVDGWKNAQLFASNGIEEKLDAISNHFQNIEIERLKDLQLDREKMLTPFEVDGSMMPLSMMSNDVWANYLAGVGLQFSAKKDAEQKAIEDRARIDKEEKERIEAQRIENEKLKADALQKENELAIERAKIEKERKDADSKLAEQRRIDAEKAAKLAAEQSAILKAEQEKAAKLAAELKGKKDAEIADKIKKDTEEKERIAAEKKAAKAPDKTKLLIWVDSISMPEIPTGISNDSANIGLEISNKFYNFKNWAKEQIKNI